MSGIARCQRQRSGLQDAIEGCRQQSRCAAWYMKCGTCATNMDAATARTSPERGLGDREQDDYGEREIRAANIAQQVLVIRSINGDPVHAESREVVVERSVERTVAGFH